MPVVYILKVRGLLNHQSVVGGPCDLAAPS